MIHLENHSPYFEHILIKIGAIFHFYNGLFVIKLIISEIEYSTKAPVRNIRLARFFWLTLFYLVLL